MGLDRRVLLVAFLLLGLWMLPAVLGVRTLAAADSLDELDEFPGEGEDGGATVGEDVSPLEITEEESATLQASLPKLYHSPEIFALSYEDMWNRMQVWVYPSQEGSARYEHKYDGAVEVTEELSSTADLLFRLLKRSDFVTEDPKRAQLFLMPVSVDALWLDLGPAGVSEQFKRYVQRIRDEYPFWDRSLGADHLYLSCHAFDRNSKHRNVLEMGKNTIQAACAPLRHNQRFYPHKDIVFPQYKPVTPQQIRAALAGRASHRPTLAYFAAPGAQVGESADPEIEVESDPSPHRSSVYEKLARTKFCVSMPPHDALDVVDALRFGCVPVLFSKSVLHDLPFQGFLNWHAFVLVLDVADLPNLKKILTSMPPETYREMQYLGHQASKHLEWNDPPVAYDAFHMTLLELWMRRHSIKYARRSATSQSE